MPDQIESKDKLQQNGIGKTEKKPNDLINKALFVLLLLFSLHFWEIRYFPELYNIYNLVTWAVCGYSMIVVFQNKDLNFKVPIVIFIIGIFFNAIAAYINFGQSPYRTILAFEFYYFILLYFLLHFLKPSRNFVENIILIFAYLYAAFFIITYKNLFGLDLFVRNVDTATMEKQLEIIGHGFLMLAFYLLLNRYLTTSRLIYIALILPLFLALLRCGFRTLIAAAVLVAFFMVIRMIRFSIKDFAILVFITLVVIGLTQNEQVIKVYNNMVTKTQGDIKEGNKYVRLVELEFFYKRYPENISYYIFGGGRPSGANLYTFDRSKIGLNYNIVWVDIGLLGFYMVIGGITTLGLLWYTFKAIFFKLPRDGRYLGFYFLYLFIASFANEEIFRNGIFSVHAIALYLIDTIHKTEAESGTKSLIGIPESG